MYVLQENEEEIYEQFVVLRNSYIRLRDDGRESHSSDRQAKRGSPRLGVHLHSPPLGLAPVTRR